MPIFRLVKRVTQPHAWAGICGRPDPECGYPISFVIPVSLLLDAKSPARTANDIFGSNVGFGISKGDAWSDNCYCNSRPAEQPEAEAQ